MGSFNERCYAILRKVPEGKITTYKAIAKAMKTRAYRAVGNAMNHNPHAPQVPCHRVIKSDGSLGGFAHGSQKKADMLRKEGVKIINGKIDLRKYLYKFNT